MVGKSKFGRRHNVFLFFSARHITLRLALSIGVECFVHLLKKCKLLVEKDEKNCFVCFYNSVHPDSCSTPPNVLRIETMIKAPIFIPNP